MDQKKKHEIIDTEILWAASDKAVRGIGESIRTGKEPDFTVTAADLRSAGSNPDYFCIAWETESAGFGELTFYRKDGKLVMDYEAMGRKFAKEVLAKLVTQVLAKLVDQTPEIMELRDPEKPRT